MEWNKLDTLGSDSWEIGFLSLNLHTHTHTHKRTHTHTHTCTGIWAVQDVLVMWKLGRMESGAKRDP